MDITRVAIHPGSNPGRLRHRHDGDELLLIEEGHGLQLSAQREHPCRRGDAFLFPKGAPHMSAAEPGQRFTCLVVNCRPGDLADGRLGDGGALLLHRLAEQCSEDHRLRIRPAVAARARALLARAHDEQRHGDLAGRVGARALVMELLALLARERPAPIRSTADAGDRHAAAARAWIDDHWMTPLRIDDLVALGPLGRSQFLQRFAATSGEPPGARLARRRLAEAQRLLLAGEASMLEIALACGYGSQSHFNHRFRAATGRSPGEWQRQQRAAPTAHPVPAAASPAP